MLWICLQCTTAYAVDTSGCPHCGSALYVEEGTDMPKISRHGGPTHLAVEAEPVLPAAMPIVEVELPVDDVEPEAVPAGTIDDIIAWTELDPAPPARLAAALEAENARPTTRITLVTELERRLAAY